MRRTPYDGRPYYCEPCGLGFAEYVACERPDCRLEPDAFAEARRKFRETAPFYIVFTRANTSVKEGNFFRSQGGLTQDWGQNWQPVPALSLSEARDIAIARRRKVYPDAPLTMRQDGSLEGEPRSSRSAGPSGVEVQDQ